MTILLLGKHGQLGKELTSLLTPTEHVVALSRKDVDLEDPDAIVKVVSDIKPTCIVNAAAYTSVDLAEVEQEKAEKINAAAPAILADQAKRSGAFFIHYSTDYVFDGSKGSLYTEKDFPNPLNFYGSSKLKGERAIEAATEDYLIFRTSWVYSLESQSSFVNKVLDWSLDHGDFRVVTDQIGNPTWSYTLALLTAQAMNMGFTKLRDFAGLYHLAGGGYASRYEWAQAIVKLHALKNNANPPEILPAISSEFPTPAQRPSFSALDCSKFENTFKLKIPKWQDQLNEAMVRFNLTY